MNFSGTREYWQPLRWGKGDSSVAQPVCAADLQVYRGGPAAACDHGAPADLEGSTGHIGDTLGATEEGADVRGRMDHPVRPARRAAVSKDKEEADKDGVAVGVSVRSVLAVRR